MVGQHTRDYYHPFSDEGPHGNFHRVIALHDSPDVDWEQMSSAMPCLPKGWFEVAQLNAGDRVEFIHAFWISQLPYHPRLQGILSTFFGQLEDIGVYLTQQTFDGSFEAQMVYSLSDDAGFFHGYPPVSDEDLVALKNFFPDCIFPVDYVAFLRVHDGFSKYTDTGFLKSSQVYDSYQTLQGLISQHEPLVISGEPVNPKSLIPFYESFGRPCYQCFWGEWYPLDEMGNVYYSEAAKTISKNEGSMAFPTFLDWLMFYLERVE